MITIKVVFQGLICHVGKDGSTDKAYSTVIKDEHHKAEVSWDGPTAGFKQLTGEEVLRFKEEGPQGGFADGSDPDFATCLPHLKQLAFKGGGNPNRHPTLGKNHTKASGYVRYREGKFTVKSWFKSKAIYCHPTTGEVIKRACDCVPDLVLLTLRFNTATVTLMDSRIHKGTVEDTLIDMPKPLAEFHSDAVVWVKNMPKHKVPKYPASVPCNHPTYGAHWKLHLNMTDGDQISDIGKEPSCEKYRDRSAAEGKSLLGSFKPDVAGEIVCSNSGYP